MSSPAPAHGRGDEAGVNVLVLAATRGELGPLEAALEGGAATTVPGRPVPWWNRERGRLAGVEVVLGTTGVGKVNAAAATAIALTELRPRHLLLVGIGGAYPGTGPGPGQVATAASETHVDSGVGHGAGWEGLDAIGFPLLTTDPPTYNRLWFDQRFVGRLAGALNIAAVPFATSEAVTADDDHARWLAQRHGVAIESMEGGAVAQVALAFGVPMVEIRGVSNVVGERDKSRWQVKAAITNACDAALRAVELLAGG